MTTYKKMDPELKEKWTTALRSGEYEQGHEVLKYSLETSGGVESRYCCLGVLLDVSGLGGWDETDLFVFDEYRRLAPLSTELSKEVLKIVGFSDKAQNKLINMNDGGESKTGRNRNFNQIADWVDKNL